MKYEYLSGSIILISTVRFFMPLLRLIIMHSPVYQSNIGIDPIMCAKIFSFSEVLICGWYCNFDTSWVGSLTPSLILCIHTMHSPTYWSNIGINPKWMCVFVCVCVYFSGSLI
jgi:hypothetical protein